MALVSLVAENAAADEPPICALDLAAVPEVGEEISVTDQAGDATTYEVTGRRFAIDLREGLLRPNDQVVLHVRTADPMTVAAVAMIG